MRSSYSRRSSVAFLLWVTHAILAAPADVQLQQLTLAQTSLVTVTQIATATLTETLTSEATQSTSVQAFAPVQDDPRIPHHVADDMPRPADAESIFFLPPGVIPTPTILNSTQPEPTLDIPVGDDSQSDSGSDPVYSGDNSTSWASHSSPLKGPLVAGYYPDWATGVLAPEDINFAIFDWIDFAFAVPDARAGITWDDPSSSPDLLRRLVAAAHSHHTKVKLSIGGWTGSKHFSTSVATDKSRQAFVGTLTKAYKSLHLDGIDIDWEYPGQQGEGSNKVSPDDSANFLTFLRLLRQTLPQSARITAAAQTVPFAGQNGKPSKNVAAFADVFDYVLLMNYDTWGSSSDPGPNAPLDDGCNNSTQPASNAKSAVRAWTKAGFPASKLMLGVPAYGYINPSKATRLHARRAHYAHLTSSAGKAVLPRSLADTAQVITVKNTDGNTNGGQVQFNELVRQGALIMAKRAGEDKRQIRPAKFVGAGGFTRFWDDCSSTPFLTSPYVNQVITYDDPESLALKAGFAKDAGMLGVSMFDVTGDTTNWDLVRSLRSGLGLSTT